MKSLSELREWVAAAPAGTMIDVGSLAEILATEVERPSAKSIGGETEPKSWREKLWTVHPDVRIGVPELAEALGRPVSYVHRHTSSRSGVQLLPHKKLDSELVFVVGEIRRWIETNEVIVVRGSRPPLHLKRSA